MSLIILFIWIFCSASTSSQTEPFAGPEAYMQIVDNDDDVTMLEEANKLLKRGVAEQNCGVAQTGLAVQFAAHLGLGAEISEELLRKNVEGICDSAQYQSFLWHSIGNYRLASGEVNHAEQAFHLALSQVESIELNRRILNSLAGCSWRRRDFESAWIWLNKAWEIAPNEAPGYLVNNLLAIDILTGHLEAAQRHATIYLAQSTPDDPIVPFIQANLLQSHLRLFRNAEAHELVSEIPWDDLVTEDPLETTKTAFQVATQLGVFAPLELSRKYWQQGDWPYAENLRLQLGWRGLAQDPTVLPIEDLNLWAQHIPVDWDGVWRVVKPAQSASSAWPVLDFQSWGASMVLLSVALFIVLIFWNRLGQIRKIALSPPASKIEWLREFMNSSEGSPFFKRFEAQSILAASMMKVPEEPDAVASRVWLQLSESERRIIECSLRTPSPKDVARELDISPKHVYNTRSRIRKKLGWSADSDFNEESKRTFPGFFTVTAIAVFLFCGFSGTDIDSLDLQQETLKILNTEDSQVFVLHAVQVERIAAQDSARVAQELGALRWMFNPWRQAWREQWSTSGITYPLDSVISLHLPTILNRPLIQQIVPQDIEAMNDQAVQPLRLQSSFQRWTLLGLALLVLGFASGSVLRHRKLRRPIRDLQGGNIPDHLPDEWANWGNELMEILAKSDCPPLVRERGLLLIERLASVRNVWDFVPTATEQRLISECNVLRQRGLSNEQIAEVLQISVRQIP